MACGGVDLPEIRIILIGRTGDGKSSTGNTIIGYDVFEVSNMARSQTKECDFKECIHSGRKVVVVDTPGFYDTELTELQILKQLLRAVVYTTPGFHAIGFVLRRGRFTEELRKTLELFQTWFGRNVKKYALLIVTDVDSDEEAQQFFHNPTADLKELKQWCGNIVLPFQNRGDAHVKGKQVNALLDAVEEIKKRNNGTHFKHIVYTIAERYAKTKSQSLSPVSFDSLCLFQKAGVDNNTLMTKHNLDLEPLLKDKVEEGASRKGKVRIFDASGEQEIFITEQPAPPAAQRISRHLQHGSEEIKTVPISRRRQPSPVLEVDDTLQYFVVDESNFEPESSQPVPVPTVSSQPTELQDFVSSSGRRRPYGSVVDEKHVFSRTCHEAGDTHSHSMPTGTQSHHSTPTTHGYWSSSHAHGGRRGQTIYEQSATPTSQIEVAGHSGDGGHSAYGDHSGFGSHSGDGSHLGGGGRGDIQYGGRSGGRDRSERSRLLPDASRSSSSGNVPPDQPRSFRENMRDESKFDKFVNFFVRIWKFLKGLVTSTSNPSDNEPADPIV